MQAADAAAGSQPFAAIKDCTSILMHIASAFLDGKGSLFRSSSDSRVHEECVVFDRELHWAERDIGKL